MPHRPNNNRYDNKDTAASPTPNPNDKRQGDGSRTDDYEPTGNYGTKVGKAGFGYGGYYSPDQAEHRNVNRRAEKTDEEIEHQGGRDRRR